MSECYLLDVPCSRLKEIVEREGASENVKDFLNKATALEVLVDPDSGALEFNFSSFNHPPVDLPDELHKMFQPRVDGLRSVSVNTSIKEQNNKLDAAWLADSWDRLKEDVRNFSPAARSAFEYARPVLNNGSLTVEMADARWIDFCTEKNIDGFIKNWLAKRCSSTPQVRFATGDFKDRIEADAKTFKEEKMEELEKKEQRRKHRIEKEKTSVPFGSKITSKPEPIEELSLGDKQRQTVTIQGKVLDWDFRQTSKGKKNLYTGLLTDYTDSISFKIFRDDDDEPLENLEGEWVKVCGSLRRDNFGRRGDDTIFARDINRVPPMIRSDEAPEKRVELHCHTNMSRMDGLVDVEDIIERAAFWDHKAVAVSDHGVVHSFPAAAAAGDKYGVKVIYGMEGYLVEDDRPLVLNSNSCVDTEAGLDTEYIVLDCETNGVSPCTSAPFHIAASRVKDGEVVDSFESPVAVDNIDEWILNHSPLDTEDILDAPPAEQVVAELQEFVGKLPVFTYEADFVRRFLEVQGFEFKAPLVHLRRVVEEIWMPEKSNLDHLHEKRFQVQARHRFDAAQDVKRTIQILEELRPALPQKLTVSALLDFQSDPDDKAASYHILILVRNQKGMRNLYELVSESHTKHFYRFPRILRSELEEKREGLIIGSACEKGEVFQHILECEPEEQMLERMKFYDFIEIQPVENNSFMVKAGETYHGVNSFEDIKKLTARVYELAKKIDKPVAATSDAHFLDPEQDIYRSVLQAGQGFSDADNQPPIYLKTTDEMIEEFEFLGEDAAIEVALKTPQQISDWCQEVRPIPDEFCPPKIENAQQIFIKTIDERCHLLYGENLPPEVAARLEKEKDAIVENQFADLYVAAARLVNKSLSDGYLVGSRGSVGSSFTAYLMEITEVNPMEAHYRCPDCSYADFPEETDADVGIDLPPAACPRCGNDLTRDGYNIPFEVFCGFEGDKVPDIDLNFSGEYQQEVFRYVQELFGAENVYRAGTITTIATQTAGGFVRGYLEERNLRKRYAEQQRLMQGITGIKQNTSQHPGGMVVVPEDRSIYEFTPINFPANDRDADFLTTHFDYHAMEEQLVKLDILGQDDPTQLRHLQDLTEIDPVGIPLDDPDTLSIFSGLDALGLDKKELGMATGVLAVPEFGTSFVREMVEQTKPDTFADLLRISGLSHGTGVWLGNAQDLIRAGKADLRSVIACRDDIMNRLIEHGVPEKISFDIMERVRKGRGVTDDQINTMRANKVPEWYIKSCQTIQYLFPKAHAAAYVVMAFRIAYFKVHHPAAFYASYCSLKADFIDANYIASLEDVEARMEEITKIINFKRDNNETTARDQTEYSVLEVAREAYLRGIKIKPPVYSRSRPFKFSVEDDSTLLAPYVTISGLGGTVAQGLKQAYEERAFSSIEDVNNRTSLNSTVLETARNLGFFQDLPATEHFDLFAG